jgi:mandelamide amidase
VSKRDHHPIGNNPDRRTVLTSLAAGVSAAAIATASGASMSWAASPTSDAELVELSAQAAVEHIRKGDLKAERYAQALLERYRAHKDLNTTTYINETRVLEDVRAVDQARAKGAPLGRLAGLPVMLKDNINTVGFPTSAGTPSLKNFMPKTNAPIADMLFKQGAVLFAKGNMHELAVGSTSGNVMFGFVKNPYDQSRIPGGSTGGGASAVAARIVPLTFGTDTSGSCRMPAHFCGIAGFRPSNPEPNKAYPLDGIVPNALAFDVPGPLARSVSDIAFTHAAITNTPAIAALQLRGARIGIPRSYYWDPMDAEVAKAMDAALARLRSAGAVLVEVDFADLAKATLPVNAILNNEGKRVDVADFLAKEYPELSIDALIAAISSPSIKARMDRARKAPANPDGLQKARADRVALMAQYEERFRQQNIAALAFPTVVVAALPIPPDGETLPEIDLAGQKFDERVLLRNMLPGTLLRAPGLSIPAGLTSNGLPVGLEIQGLTNQDSNLLALGMAVEKALGPVPAPTFRKG